MAAFSAARAGESAAARLHHRDGILMPPPENQHPNDAPAAGRPNRLRGTFISIFAGYAITVILLAGLSLASMEILTAVRAYVGGESLWTKAQKAAVIELVQYAGSADPSHWEAHQEALQVLQGYRRAREALQSDPADLEAARAGFRQGGIHPHDIEGMIRFFRWFGGVGRVREAIAIWEDADSLTDELQTEARALRREVESSGPGSGGVAASVARIDSLDVVLSRHERAFSRELAGTAHSFRRWVYRGIAILSLLLLLFGGGAAWNLYHRLRNREAALRRSNRRYRRIFRDSQDAIYVTRRDGTIEEMNPAGVELLGYPPEELADMHAAELYADPTDRTRFEREIQKEGMVQEFEVRLETRAGETLDCLLTSTARREGEGIIGYQGIIRDVTEQKKFERELQHQALHDTLTELPNRALFWDRVEQAMARIRRRGGRAALLFVDLDRFKAINDSLGHSVGDRVLVEVTRRLEAAVRDPDTVARLGGDEFGILLEEIVDASDATEVAGRISDVLESPFLAKGQDIHLSASIGISLIPDAGGGDEPEEPDEVIRRADTAMYRAKTEPGTHYRIFDPDLDADEASRVQQESDLRRAVEAGELRLLYQPVLATDSGEVVAVEPLLRWQHPERGLLPPDDFLGLAEETGLIRQMDEWVLAEACRRVERWNRARPDGRAIRVQPNVSAMELSYPEYTANLRETLEDTGLDPELLMLEVTEHAALKSGDRIEAIRRIGVRVAVDDFGTGYSSFTYVKHLRVDALKVDRSFVLGLPDQDTDQAIVETIITLAHSLDIEVIGEGVETEEQLEWLRSHGCDSVQGFHLARPATPKAVEDLLFSREG